MTPKIPKLAAVVAALCPAAVGGATLDDVKQRGSVHCGTAPNIPGYAFTDAQGNRQGFDIDLCRALAAAICNRIACIETLIAGIAMRSLSLKSASFFTAGLRVLR